MPHEPVAEVNVYAGTDEFREHLGDTGSKLDSDLIARALNASSRAIDRFCGYPMRKFWLDSTAVARVFRADDPEVLWTPDIGVTSVTVKTDTTGDGVFDLTWDADDFQLEPLNIDVAAAGDTGTPFAFTRIVAINGRRFPVHRRRATAEATTRWGWSGIPDEVGEACLIKSVSLFRRKDAPFGVAGFDQFGSVRISRRGDPDVVALLEPYVRLRVGVI